MFKKRINSTLRLLFYLTVTTLMASWNLAEASGDNEYPRLIGMNIGKKHYQNPSYQRELAKYDIVVLGFYRGWGRQRSAIREVVSNLKKLNPEILVGQYSVMNEQRDDANDKAKEDIRKKINDSNWWLRKQSGERVQWTNRYNAWEVNFTKLAKPDADGKRYPQWLAERDYHVYHQAVPGFDFWYTDNVMRRPRVKADWDGNGVDDDPDTSLIIKSWREGYIAWWKRIRELTPDMMIMGNTDSDLSQSEFKGQLDAAFLEAMMGKKWSIETRNGWDVMMTRYRTVKNNLKEPRIIGFNVSGDTEDYRFFRYAFTSCLLDDGYFSFTDKKRGYSSVPWFDEYDIKLGHAISPPPVEAWKNGVWHRVFEHGVVLINPNDFQSEVELEENLWRFSGRQDPNWNTGAQVRSLIMPPKDGIILVRKKSLN
ncbi:MAG: putative glycoside hydrolase family 15 protein [Candidatus Thiodiazotropha sp. (ex Lucinoma borealis)]|nr:putative glycoside hydrolase family 15 protein [Candidatus Thiodiazotropha sp. (ex Lucinoma borealis)]MCU7867947.1 putative glycoside hydrolase family 15 protein [Candidatus Thiodiazotropha sp. (ex Lucinoma borealis)]